MERNFVVSKSNALRRGETLYDLHNCYEFTRVAVDADRTVRLYFEPSVTHAKGLPKLELVAVGVDHFELSPGFGTVGATTEFDEVGYKSPGDQDLAWISREEDSTPKDHLFFSFGPVHYIRLHAAKIELHAKEVVADCAGRSSG